MQHHDGHREQLQRNIADDRTELRRALRDLGLSLLISLNLPRRIRRRPLPWALGAVALAAILIARRKRGPRQRRWWDGAQAYLGGLRPGRH